MRTVSSIGQLPNDPAVYAMYGGGERPYVAYVGLAGNLRGRIEQHLVRRDSSVTTGTAAVSLNVDLLPVVQADLREWLVASGIRSGLIVPRPSGGAWTETDWRNWRKRIYRPTAEVAGVTGDMRPYRLRGAFASLLLYEGRPVTYVADQTGHSVAVLSKHYAGVIAQLESAPRTSADEAIRAARVHVLDAQRTRKTG